MKAEESNPLDSRDIEAVEKLQAAAARLREELGKAIVGQDEVVEQLLMCIFARGHAILEGVPGLAKTLLVSSLAACLDLSFSRIQFTPDLMPSDITGAEVIAEDKATGSRAFTFLKGPIFANVVLADEINRTPPKTQAALLESMQERQVSVGGDCFEMADPFFVLATQNPIEQEGTYPLPEAQQDRFMFKIFVDYPNWDEEFDIIRLTTAGAEVDLAPCLDGPTVTEMQRVVRRVPVADHVIHYALRLVRATRITEADAPEFVRRHVSWGAGPRACQFLILGGKARAVLQGRFHVGVEDIRAVAPAVLRHRIITNFSADAEGVTPDTIIAHLIESVSVGESSVAADAGTRGILKN